MINSEWLMICYLLFFTDYSQWCICHVRNCGGFRSKNPLRTIEWERRSTGAGRSAKLSRAAEFGCDFKVLVEQGTEAGTIEATEQDMVQRVLQLNDQEVSVLMTPRSAMTCPPMVP